MKNLESSKRSVTRKRARDILLYCIIGLGVAGVALFLGIYDSDHNISSDNQIRWIAAIVFTAFVFGVAVKTALEAKLLHRRVVWGLLSVLAVVQGASLAALAKITGPPPLSLYGIAAIAEIFFFRVMLKKCVS